MKKRILIADDEPDLIEIAVAFLERPEWEIVTTIDGVTTMKMLECNHFDLVILDILMPKPDGLKIARWIRGNEQTKNVPIIILSAISEENTLNKAINIGVNEFITKPFDFETLERTVSKYLN
ncbi:MAG: response regulator [Candidatus Marinimicrobia bacterium]|nr:response regulator [Candidatus Neomarinimicrobiota bacterium]